jgi:anti-sigma factor RsiW
MMHTYIQEKLLLYLDGDLPDEEMQHIRDHLSTCSDCTDQSRRLESVWHSENRLEKVTPSPFLWTRLEMQIMESERSPVFVWDRKTILHGITMHPIPAFAAVVAIAAGIYLGTPQEAQTYEQNRSVSQLAGTSDELGLNHFDVIPPGTLGSSLVDISSRQK